MRFRLFLAAVFSALLSVAPARAGVAEYNFDIEYKTVSPAGEPVRTMVVDGGIPGPTIEAKLGDTLRVTFNNKLDVETSIHWHGVLLPADQDGVPHLNTRPIAPGTSFTFEFPVRVAGTYWYHSHTGLQEQRGVYGSIVFHPETEAVKSDRDYVVVFSDWTNEDPDKVLHNLKRDGDYYALKKGSVQSWDKVIASGGKAISARLDAAWSRMGPMDLSDIGYDAFLTNGEAQTRIGPAKPGERIRLRLINAGASSYFDVEFAGGPMTIVAADGIDVESRAVKRLRMAVAETYDVIVTLPDARAYELRATATDGTGYTVGLLGEGDLVAAPDVPKPDLFIGMEMGGMEMEHAGHTAMKMGPLPHMTDYESLRALEATTFSTERPVREVILNLTGDMERYVWSINNRTLSESERILIRKGEVVRFRLVNKTMMAHPMHLHGHFFRVITSAGAKSPLKHTVNVPPMSTLTIEFLANEERDWFFHCHMLYHMMSGMAAVVSYEATSQAEKGVLKSIAEDRNWFAYADIGAQSNKATGRLWARDKRFEVSLDYDYDWKHEYEVEALVERRLSRWLGIYAGANFEADEDGDKDQTGVIGIRYLLPMMIEADLRIDTEGHVRVEVGSELQLTSRLTFDWHVDTDEDYELGLEYEISKSVSLTASHGSQYEAGGGILVKF